MGFESSRRHPARAGHRSAHGRRLAAGLLASALAASGCAGGAAITSDLALGQALLALDGEPEPPESTPSPTYWSIDDGVALGPAARYWIEFEGRGEYLHGSSIEMTGNDAGALRPDFMLVLHQPKVALLAFEVPAAPFGPAAGAALRTAWLSDPSLRVVYEEARPLPDAPDVLASITALDDPGREFSSLCLLIVERTQTLIALMSVAVDHVPVDAVCATGLGLRLSAE